MNSLYDLINKLQKLEEADPVPAPASDAVDPNVERQYRQIQANDAKTAAIAQVKKYMSKPINQIGRLENLIDPTSGFIYYGEAGMDAFNGTPKKMAFKFMSQGDQSQMMQAITAAGLKVVDNGGYAYINPATLKSLGQPAPAPAPAPTGNDQKPAPTGNAEVRKKIDRIKQIIGLGATNATVNTAGAPNMAQVNKESIFKSLIGKALLESFDLGLNEALSPREELDALWSELQRGVQSGFITGSEATEIDQLGAAVNKFQQANPIAGNDQKPVPAPKPKLQGPKEIGALQDFFNKKGITSNDGKPLVVDNLYGQKSSEAQDNFYKKYPNMDAPERKQLDALIDAIPKEWRNRFIGPGANSTKGPGNDQKVAPTIPGNDQKVTPVPPGGVMTGKDIMGRPVMKGSPNDVSDKTTTPKFTPDLSATPKPTGSDQKVEPTAKASPYANKKVSPQPVIGQMTGGGGRQTPYRATQADVDQWNKNFGADHNPDGTPKKLSESGFANEELTRLVSLIHHR